MKGPKNIRENQSLKAQGLPYRFPKTIGGESGEIESEWETHTVQYWADGDFYGILLEELAVKGSGIPTPLIYRKVGETYTELTELPLSTIPPVGFYAIDYHGTKFESTSRVFMHEDMNGWTIVVKRYAGLGRVPRKPRKNAFVQNVLKVNGAIIGNETAYAGAVNTTREQLAIKEIITEDVNSRFNLIEHGIANGKSRIVSWCSHYRPSAPKFRDVSFLPRELNAQKWYGGNPNGVGKIRDANDEAADPKAVAYGNGVWVAVGYPIAGSTSVWSSLNGIEWTPRNAPEANNWSSVTYGNGWFVAVATSGTHRVMRSQDGITWTTASAAEANSWNAVAYGNGKFIAVASTGTNRAMVSSDNGATWTASNIGSRSWTGVAYGAGVWVAVASGHLKRSTDNGSSWDSEATAGAGLALSRRVSYSQGYFVTVAHDSGALTLSAYRSANGASWSLVSVSAGPDGDRLDICAGLGLHVIVEATALFISSDGGATWTPYVGPLNNVGSSGAFGDVREIAFGQSAFTLVGGTGSVAWTEKNFADDEWLSVITDINDEAASVNREVYTYILYKQADA